MEKNIVHAGERINYPKEDYTPELLEILEDLQKKLTEQDMVLSIFQSINGISAEVYRIVKDDYRQAFTACNLVKNKVSRFVMDRFEGEDGATLSWSYSSSDNSLVVYLSNQM